MNGHGQIFTAYVAELRKSKGLAEAWWAQLHARETAHLGDAERAQRAVAERWPFGAASHPFVLATYRKYFLQCEALNKELEAAEAAEDDDEDDDDDDWGTDDSEDDDDDSLAFDFEGPDQPITGYALLIDMLPGHHPDLQKFLEWMVYAPIGLDADGETV